jgi:hypothetical protein
MKNITKTGWKAYLLLLGVGFLVCSNAQAQRTATAVARVENGAVVAITLADPGSGYMDVWIDPYPKITLDGGGGSGAKATASGFQRKDNTDLMEIKGIDVLSGGTGYTSAPAVIIPSPDQSKANYEAKLALEKMERRQERRQESAPVIEATAVGVAALCLVVVAWYWTKRSHLFGNLANKELRSVKKLVYASCVILALAFAVHWHDVTHPQLVFAREQMADNSVDPDPAGTWTTGDRNLVLAMSSSGRFRLEPVHFTDDLKGGYSGRCQMNGNSIRFEWGSGGADSGSCSGRKMGRNGLVFGSTTFSR